MCVQCEQRSCVKQREKETENAEKPNETSERELEMRGGKYEGTDLNCAFYHLWR